MLTTVNSGFAHAAKTIELRACVASVEVLDELFNDCADPTVSESIRSSLRSKSDQPSVPKRFPNAPLQTPPPHLWSEPSPFPATSKVQPMRSRFMHQIQSTGQKMAENSTVATRRSSQRDGRAKSGSLSNSSDEVD